MAKMLMGQIDHARDRIRELAQLKTTDAPKAPTFPKGNDVLNEIRRGERTISSTILKKAFDRFVNQVPMKGVEDDGEYWDYNNRRYIKHPPKLFDRAPTTIEGAIRDVIYEKDIKAGLAKFVAEQEVYEERKQIINDKAKETEDLIVLGDVHAALQALKDFEAFEV